jgi:hypothetical protein
MLLAYEILAIEFSSSFSPVFCHRLSESFSYLPPHSEAEIAKQIYYMVRHTREWSAGASSASRA